jgi:polynucleotide 5'-hydroxyl-kinase GRC3/NOL9
MLSAIAARKAAQATSRETSGEIVEPITTAQTPSAKRKPLSQKRPDQSWKKKKRKDKDKEKQVTKTRYFQEPQKDLFEAQEDVMVIDSDEEGMSEDQELHETSNMPAPQTSKRRSSSRAPADSSDEESDEDDGNREGDVIMDIHTSTPLPSTDNVLSTFQSTLDRNVFFLTSHQVHDLHVLSFSECPGTLLALEPGETLCLLGAYTFCVLQGSVCFCGVNIPASMRTHRVFAPRSSPLPILEGLAGIDKISGLEHKLPGQIRWVIDTHITLVLLQDLRTGVEGLGRVCRTFNGVFEPSRWQKNGVLGTPLQLSEVHLVCAFSRTLPTCVTLICRLHTKLRMFKFSDFLPLGKPLSHPYQYQHTFKMAQGTVGVCILSKALKNRGKVPSLEHWSTDY